MINAPGMEPAEWLEALLASDLSSMAKIYAVMVASCADGDGRVLIDGDGWPIPVKADLP